MEQLAQRIYAKADWNHLVLPAEQTALLHNITDLVSSGGRHDKDCASRQQISLVPGIHVLFSGESGTGKTMAAEVIANDRRLDLYRIDLSAVVNKYIGETEKNLNELFDKAEDSNAILFFDEADALLSKRGEVKHSHDRYANIDMAYLLQRMESYRGLVILATKMKSAFDDAFLRRLQFVVDFPYPGIKERTEIWQMVFSPGASIDKNFSCERLARLRLSGGNIHKVALNAAFRAAQKGSPITMRLVLNAARSVFKKT